MMMAASHTAAFSAALESLLSAAESGKVDLRAAITDATRDRLFACAGLVSCAHLRAEARRMVGGTRVPDADLGEFDICADTRDTLPYAYKLFAGVRHGTDDAGGRWHWDKAAAAAELVPPGRAGRSSAADKLQLGAMHLAQNCRAFWTSTAASNDLLWRRLLSRRMMSSDWPKEAFEMGSPTRACFSHKKANEQYEAYVAENPPGAALAPVPVYNEATGEVELECAHQEQAYDNAYFDRWTSANESTEGATSRFHDLHTEHPHPDQQAERWAAPQLTEIEAQICAGTVVVEGSPNSFAQTPATPHFKMVRCCF